MTTTTDVAVREASGALAIQDGQVSWDPMQLAALAQIGLKDAPDGDKQVFLHVSQRTGLDPFARQIYMIPRSEKKSEKQPNGQWIDRYTVKWTIQTGIEGWRVIRDRAERRYGVRGIKGRFIYYDTKGDEHKVWVRREPPVACEMTYTVVESTGREVPYTSILRFDEYAQTKKMKVDGVDKDVLIAQWGMKPTHMLEKCTEADAYRCAFPQDYSGVVLDDAMPRPEDAPQPPPRVTAEEIRSRRPRPARAEVVDAEVVEDAPPFPGDAAPATAVAPEPPAHEDDPRAAAHGHLNRLGIPGHENRMNYAGQLLDIAAPASLDSLARVQAEKLVSLLAMCMTKADVDALLKTGEVPGHGE